MHERLHAKVETELSVNHLANAAWPSLMSFNACSKLHTAWLLYACRHLGCVALDTGADMHDNKELHVTCKNHCLYAVQVFLCG